MDEQQWKGIGLCVLGAMLWGLSGTAVQFVENARHINVEWLLEIRLLVAGFLTILLSYMKDGMRIFDVFKNRKDCIKLLIFGIFGIAMAQYTYFRAIMISGVGVATVLQYVAPTMLIVYLFIRYFKKPTFGEALCVVLAMIGTICIVLQKGLDFSKFNTDALIWGLLSAAGICVYSLEPVELLKKYSTTSIVGFAMFICGILSVGIFQTVASDAIWDGMTWLGLFAIIILGTVVSFNAYIEGVRLIGAVRGSILSSLEPISAALFGWALLGNMFTPIGIVGMVLIILTVLIIGYESQRKMKQEVIAHLEKRNNPS